MKRLQLYAGYSSFIALCLLLVGCQTQVVNSSDTEQRSQQTIATQSTSDTIDNIYQAKPNEAVIYYKRNDNNYDGWGLHLWDGDSNTTNANELAAGTSWGAAHPASGVHPDLGAYFIVPMNRDDWIDFMFIVHKGDEKDLGGIDHLFNRAKVNSQILYTFQGVSKLYNQPHRVPPISIDGASAHWLDASTIAFNPGAVPTVKLFYSQNADIRTNAENKSIEGGTEVVLKRGQLSEELKTRFPHLADFKAWSLPSGFDAKAALKGQLVVATFNPDGSLEAATLVQKSAVLDAVFASAAAEVNLGAIVDQGSTRFSVWAPTAQNITLKLYKKPSSKAKALAMSFDQDSGVWIYDSKKNLSGYFYRYDIRVYHPESNQIEQYEVTDPYSLSLSTNSKFSQVVDLDAENLKPARWGQGQYVVAQPEDIVIYESHLRDLTLSDQLGTATLNGKYGALAETDRASVQHLMALQQAGLTHLHLLPSFDIATTNEFAGEQVNIDDKVSRLCQLSGDFRQSEFGQYCETDLSIRDVLTGFPGDSDQQQNLMSFVRPLDNFNWGYDPFHYTVPEGSYAVNANGTDRILEYRDMVQSIHDMGLNFVMDVVYNHTNEAGLASKSVLDKVVPGYYHRLNIESGAVENSTCCKNTASENRMMEKLMIDSLVVWARDYHVDAFRFDLMGHHMKSNLEKAFEKVKAVRPNIYFYGEGWNFGEVVDGARGENAIQWNMAGTGIGTFSDRLRDAVRGGGPFDEGDSLRFNQGFGNGLYYLPNEMRQGDDSDKQDLLHKSDQIRVGLAGNLRHFVLINKDGFPVFGQDIDYNGMPAGYTLDPQENISYVSKHDNQTLWDNNQYRIASDITTAERVRMQNLGLATNMFAQGVPFFHMGSDILRSKSMERDSYDSGDWFNAVDFSLADSTWAKGLPRKDKDGNNWHLVEQAFANPNSYSEKSDREMSAAVFLEYLAIRKSSPLFRLTSAEDIIQRVDFHNTGNNQVPGVIAMSIDDGIDGKNLDPKLDAIVVVINASNVAQTIQIPGARKLQLHPMLQNSIDDVVRRSTFEGGEVRVPGLTVAVFVQPQQDSRTLGLPVKPKDLTQMPSLGKESIYLLGTLTSWEKLLTENQFQFIGNNQYAIELSLDKGFYKVKTGNNSGLNYSKLGALLEPSTTTLLVKQDSVMNLSISEEGVYRFVLNFSNKESPSLDITKVE